ncbi:hypothetical protein K402DRAFT_390133 [Aulographum hederae CBS 113979]|uniref:3'-5' exonuclease domain-containing protein n=1 Tax=Aulographum hederae CBS 113979 TaxID=1176131 RepID=A0A6G1HBC0_9PEZI|nr:hypothetical protein K402DRAFT_390133 [Aulographum hederae CBS 113979]
MTTIKTEIIDTTKRIVDLVDWLVSRHAPPNLLQKPTMYIDLEGINLCREGSVSILSLLIDTGTPITRIYLIDVHAMGLLAFNTPSIQKKTLKDILEDRQIPKVFLDVRNDSDALFAHFGIALQGVEDVQLMESATRPTTRSRKHLGSLAKCIEQNMSGSFDRASWKLAKEKGENCSSLNSAAPTKSSTGAQSLMRSLRTVLVMCSVFPKCGISSGWVKGANGELYLAKRPGSVSRALRDRTISPMAGIRRWLHGVKLRMGFWMSGSVCLHFKTDLMMVTSIKMVTMGRTTGKN